MPLLRRLQSSISLGFYVRMVGNWRLSAASSKQQSSVSTAWQSFTRSFLFSQPIDADYNIDTAFMTSLSRIAESNHHLGPLSDINSRTMKSWAFSVESIRFSSCHITCRKFLDFDDNIIGRRKWLAQCQLRLTILSLTVKSKRKRNNQNRRGLKVAWPNVLFELWSKAQRVQFTKLYYLCNNLSPLPAGMFCLS